MFRITKLLQKKSQYAVKILEKILKLVVTNHQKQFIASETKHVQLLSLSLKYSIL